MASGGVAQLFSPCGDELMSRVLHTSLTRVTQLVHPIIINAVFGSTLSFNNVSGENFLHGKNQYMWKKQY